MSTPRQEYSKQQFVMPHFQKYLSAVVSFFVGTESCRQRLLNDFFIYFVLFETQQQTRPDKPLAPPSQSSLAGISHAHRWV
jgi:hypothetical protein